MLTLKKNETESGFVISRPLPESPQKNRSKIYPYTAGCFSKEVNALRREVEIYVVNVGGDVSIF